MPKRELIRRELAVLYDEGAKLATAFQQKEEKAFHYAYQRWYTKALKAMASLAPDRCDEFCRYYEIDPKRKSFGYGTYVIQDFLMNVVPTGHGHDNFDDRAQTLSNFFNQLTILKAVDDRIESVLTNIEGELYSELQESEIEIARQLVKISARAAGALVGVVIEGHLQKAVAAHRLRLAKKNPTIAELNETLKAAGLVDMPTWRKISFLADLRNLCSHKKDADPTKGQVAELIQGAEWLTKNVF